MKDPRSVHFLVLSKDNCPFCVNAKELIEKRGDKYVEININGDVPSWKTLIQWHTGHQAVTVPQIYRIDTFERIVPIGGYAELEKYYV